MVGGMETSQQSERVAKEHHQYTGKGQDYVCFQVKCGTCGMLLFEFVHRQQYLTSQERIMAMPDPNPPMAAHSWYKPAVKVICKNDAAGIEHVIEPVGVGQDRNQVVTSAPWTRQQFEKWMEEEEAQ